MEAVSKREALAALARIRKVSMEATRAIRDGLNADDLDEMVSELMGEAAIVADYAEGN